MKFLSYTGDRDNDFCNITLNILEKLDVAIFVVYSFWNSEL